jgi:hypothetical protein
MRAMVGVDPHQGSHTAVAIGPAEEPLGRQQVRACPDQARQLLAWAAVWPERTWAVEGATGLGRLLAGQLAAAGERVLDIQPKLAEFNAELQVGRATTARRSSRHGTIRRTPRRKPPKRRNWPRPCLGQPMVPAGHSPSVTSSARRLCDRPGTDRGPVHRHCARHHRWHREVALL